MFHCQVTYNYSHNCTISFHNNNDMLLQVVTVIWHKAVLLLHTDSWIIFARLWKRAPPCSTPQSASQPYRCCSLLSHWVYWLLDMSWASLGRGVPPYQVASWFIQLFGPNRHGPKTGGSHFWGVLGRHLIQNGLGRGPPPDHVASWSTQPLGQCHRRDSTGQTTVR